MSSPQLAIIGAGPAGLAAAREAARRGVRVALIDDNPLPGGQYFRQATTDALREIVRSVLQEDRRTEPALEIVKHPSVEYHSEAVVFGIFDENVLIYVRNGRVGELHPEYVIVAAGATERAVPFPGWTVPGVVGGGGALNLIKAQGVRPGNRILVSGAGPLGILVAATLVRTGGNVVEVLEAAHVSLDLLQAARLLANPEFLLKGLGYRATLLRTGIPYRTGWIIVGARGGVRVSEAVIAPISAQGVIDHASSRVVKVDTVVAAFGLVPSAEITRSLGCPHRYQHDAGGWIPIRSADLETGRANVFSIGDCAGIGGVEAALLEGQLVGLVVAYRLGLVAEREMERISTGLRRRLSSLRNFRIALASVLPAPQDFHSLLTDDTVVCRCEDVTVGQLRECIQTGAVDMESVKSTTRMSMGRCQGRNCLATMAALLARETGRDPQDLSLPQARPPMRPLLIGDLIMSE